MVRAWGLIDLDTKPIAVPEICDETPNRRQAQITIAPSAQERRDGSVATSQSPGLDKLVGEIESPALDKGPGDVIRTAFTRFSGRAPEDVPATSQALANLIGRLRNLEEAVRSIVRDQEYLREQLLDRLPGGPVARSLLGGRPPGPEAGPSGRPTGGRSLAHPDTIPTGEAGGRGRSPYLDATEAAAYLGITLKSLYGIVERGHLEPLRGPRRRYRFTSAMLDEYLARRGCR